MCNLKCQTGKFIRYIDEKRLTGVTSLLINSISQLGFYDFGYGCDHVKGRMFASDNQSQKIDLELHKLLSNCHKKNKLLS